MLRFGMFGFWQHLIKGGVGRSRDTSADLSMYNPKVDTAAHLLYS
jgi:hypothetical protein